MLHLFSLCINGFRPVSAVTRDIVTHTAAGLNFGGMFLTGIGAYIAAKAVMLTEQQAGAISGTYWDGNAQLERSLLW